jgi:hypothetical protein
MGSHKPRPKHISSAAEFVSFDRSVSPDELKIRLAERDQRQAADDRTETEKILGDPPQNRSALADRILPGKLKPPS